MVKPRWFRPGLLVGVVATVGLLMAVACGEAEDPTPTATPTRAPATPTPTATPTVPAVVATPTPTVSAVVATPTPTKVAMPEGVKAQTGIKRGGVVKVSGSVKMAHYDLHQSTTINNIMPQGAMYNSLVRMDPPTLKKVIPDLAKSWEVSADGLTYTFHLEEGVKFHDGTPFTADDVVATYNRIIWPPAGVLSPRQGHFAAVERVEAVNPLTVRFTLARRSAFILQALAQDFNAIVSKKALEANDYDLRRVPDHPGTGPFRSVRVTIGEIWVQERNPDYWNEGLPYLDEVHHLNVTSGPARGAAVQTGQADYAFSGVTPEFLAIAEKDPNFEGFVSPSSSARSIYFNLSRKPWDDIRVRRAVQLVTDNQALTDVAEDQGVFPVGEWVVPPPVGQWMTVEEFEKVMKSPGYRSPTVEDIAEAKRLLAEAGYPDGMTNVDLLIRAQRFWTEAFAPAFSDMLRRNLNIDVVIKPSETSVWYDEVALKDFDISMGASLGTIEDPSDYWNQFFRTGAGQNYSGYSNPDFDAVMDQIDQELDVARRMELVMQGRAMLEADLPIIIHGWSAYTSIWRSDVKGLYRETYGLYCGGFIRLDQVWLDR
ncbi:ABC transporter substrate-binding protein [Chloroflexota bacterium]